MSITAIIFLGGFILTAALALLRHPAWGIGLYLWTYYNAPVARWWGSDLPDIRWSLFASIIAVLALLRLPSDPAQNRAPWHANWGARLLILFVAWVWLQSFWAVNGTYHEEGAILFAKYLALYIIVYKTASEPWGFDAFALAHILGCGLLGWFAFTHASTGRLEGFGAPNVEDANLGSAQLVTGLVFCGFYYLILRGRGWLRLGVCLAVPFIVNTIILAASRGALLAVIGAAPAAVYLTPKAMRRKVVLSGALGVLLFGALANDEFWARMETMVTGQYQREATAEGRLRLIDIGLSMAKDHPFGSGHRGFEALSPAYLETEDLSDNRRAAHNTFIAVLVDQGIPGAALFLSLEIWCILSLITKREDGALSTEVALKKAAIGASLAALFVAGQFSNLLKAEVQVWLVAMLAALNGMSAPALASLPDAVVHLHPLQRLGQFRRPAGWCGGRSLPSTERGSYST